MLPAYQSNVGVPQQQNFDPNSAAGVIQGLSPIINAGVGLYGSQNASEAQQQGSTAAQQTMAQYMNTATQNAQPYTAAGGAAMNALGSYYGLPGYGAFNPSVIQNMPGYQFQMQQGTQALQQSMAAKGLLNSGATGEALQQYGQGLAGTYANQYASQLQGIGAMGLNATNALNTNLNSASQATGSAQIYSGNAQASGYGSQTAAVQQGLYGLPQLVNGVSNMFGGGNSGNGYNGGNYSGPQVGFPQYDQNGPQPTYDPNMTQTNMYGLDPNADGGGLYDLSGGFNSAGGEAAQVASNVQSTDNSAVAGWSTVAPQMNPTLQNVGFDSNSVSAPNLNIAGGGPSAMQQVSSAAGIAGNILSVYQGLQKGGVSGYGSAALNAGSLANKAGAFGGSSSVAGGVLGSAGGILGVYNGLKQGGAAGDVQAALGAANALAGVGSLAGGVAAGGLGSLAAIGSFAGPIGLALAPILMGMTSAPVQLTGQYYNNLDKGLTTGQGSNATLNANQPAAIGQEQSIQKVYQMVQNGTINQASPQIQQWAAQNGLLDPNTAKQVVANAEQQAYLATVQAQTGSNAGKIL